MFKQLIANYFYYDSTEHGQYIVHEQGKKFLSFWYRIC